MDGISTFPQNSEAPVVSKLETSEKVLDVIVYGDVDERVLLNITKELNKEMKELSEVSFTEINGDRDKEITIEVSENNLEKYNLSFDQISMAINKGSIDLPGGLLSSKSGDLLIRTVGQSYNAIEYENIVIKGQPDGSQLLLKDIATITDGFIDVERYYRWDGIPAMFISVNLVGDQDVLLAADQLRKYVKSKQSDMPAIESYFLASPTKKRLLHGEAIAIGMVLEAYLSVHCSGLEIEEANDISFGGALIILPQIGVTVNILSAFMFIVVLGIVVDDAIIVGENVFRRRINLKENNMDSTIKGTMEVLIPVFFGVLTTIVVFAPMLNLAGQTGGIWKTFPLTAIPILVFSLIESTTILPAHLYRAGEWFQTSFVGFGKRLKAVRNYSSEKLYRFVDNFWMPLVKKSITNRYVTISAFIGMMIMTLSLLAGGLVKWQFFPVLEAQEVGIVFELPEGSPIEKTQAITQIIESEALKLKQELNTTEPEIIISHVLTTVGQHYFANAEAENSPSGGAITAASTPHLGEVVIVLTPAENRWGLTGAYDIIDEMRSRIGTIPGVERLNYSANVFTAGKSIHFEFSGDSFEKLNQVAKTYFFLAFQASMI